MSETWMAPFPFQVAYVFECSVCSQREEFWFDVPYRGQEVLGPSPPNNWRIMDGVLVCPQHKFDMEVMIDGIKRTLERDPETRMPRWMTADEVLRMVIR